MTTAPTRPIAPSPLSAATERDPPPHARIAEVVGMAGVAPEAMVHHLARARRVGLEPRQLCIADRLEQEADEPHHHADCGERTEPGRVGDLPELHRQGHDPHQCALQREHRHEADHPELWTPVLSHRPVPVVLGLAPLAPGQVRAEPQPPDRDHRDEQPLACRVAVGHRAHHPRDDHEPERPHRIDDRRVPPDEAEQPRDQHREPRSRRPPPASLHRSLHTFTMAEASHALKPGASPSGIGGGSSSVGAVGPGERVNCGTPGAPAPFGWCVGSEAFAGRGDALTMGYELEPSNVSGVRTVLLAALIDGDLGIAYAITTGLLEEGVPFETLMTDVIGPIQSEIGRRWADGDLTIADEHASTAATENLVALLAGTLGPAEGPTVVIACPENDTHSLAGRVVAAALAVRGFRALFLGASLPAGDLGDYLEHQQPMALALSVSMGSSLFQAAQSVTIAHAQGIPVIIGGQAMGRDGDRAARSVPTRSRSTRRRPPSSSIGGSSSRRSTLAPDAPASLGMCRDRTGRSASRCDRARRADPGRKRDAPTGRRARTRPRRAARCTHHRRPPDPRRARGRASDIGSRPRHRAEPRRPPRSPSSPGRWISSCPRPAHSSFRSPPDPRSPVPFGRCCADGADSVHSGVKYFGSRADTCSVNLHRCPYDGTSIEAEAYSGGSFLLSCTACGAEWEAHNSLVLRVTAPDWDAARRAKTEAPVDSDTATPA